MTLASFEWHWCHPLGSVCPESVPVVRSEVEWRTAGESRIANAQKRLTHRSMAAIGEFLPRVKWGREEDREPMYMYMTSCSHSMYSMLICYCWTALWWRLKWLLLWHIVFVQLKPNITFTMFYKLGWLFHGCIQEHKGHSPVPDVLQLLGASAFLPNFFKPRNYASSVIRQSLLEQLSTVIARRLMAVLYGHLPDTQAGFRPARGCRNNVCALRWFIAMVLREGRNAVISFIDYSEAFDTESQIFLDGALADAGVSAKVRRIIQAFFTAATGIVRVRLPSGVNVMSESFNIERGVLPCLVHCWPG